MSAADCSGFSLASLASLSSFLVGAMVIMRVCECLYFYGFVCVDSCDGGVEMLRSPSSCLEEF